jgi:hypothetical protein
MQFFCSKHSACQTNQGNSVQNPFLFSFLIKGPQLPTTESAHIKSAKKYNLPISDGIIYTAFHNNVPNCGIAA